ncbi:MAG: response regulator [Lentisphaerae bacterium]|nr:response regulator [Lentisphaerota bacterium]
MSDEVEMAAKVKPWKNDESCLRTVMDNISEHINIIAPDGTVLWHHAGVSGFVPVAVGTKCWKLFENRDSRCPHCVHPDVLRDGKTREYEASIRDKNGNETGCWWVRATPLRDAEGSIYAILETATDIRERKEAAAERLQLEEKVHQAEKLESLGVLAGGIAHDFNNLLTAIMGHTELAMDDVAPDSEAAERMRDVHRGAKRAASLCGEMLAYSGQGQFVMRPVNLSQSIRDMCQIVEATADKNVAFVYDLAEAVPAVAADETQIRQVVINLLTNGVDAIGGKEGRVTVSTRCESSSGMTLDYDYRDAGVKPLDCCVLEISDTGRGMDAATCAQVFEPYFTTKGSGRGLGMCAVLGIIRGHKGGLRVTSKPGRGTTFRMVLPVTSEPAQQGEGAPAPAAAGERSSGVILVVDDEHDIRFIAASMLRQKGFEVLTALDGADAIRVFNEREADIDCILLDLTMPTLGGREVFHSVRKVRPEMPILFASGYDRDAIADGIVTSPFCGFIAKPFSSSGLLNALSRVRAGAGA